MIGIVIVAHGNLAQAFLEVVRLVAGKVEGVRAVSLDYGQDPEESLRRVRRAVEEVDRGAGVLVLTDMFGGTPTNLALSLLEEGKVEVITGLNLPLLLHLVTSPREGNLGQLARSACAQGRQNLCLASDLLRDAP